jgi:hypothetical protein
MAVAFVALLAALSGTAVALPGKNTVDSGDLKKGAVKNRDVAKNAVTGTKVKNSSLTGSDVRNGSLTGSDVSRLTGGDVNDDSLTGADLNESALAKVPSATTADTAAAVNGLTFLPRVTANPGETKTVATKGPLTLQLRCIDQGGGTTEFILEIDSSADNAAADANVGGGDDDDLDAADPPLDVASDSDTAQSFEQAGWSALTPSGERFESYGFAAGRFGGANNCIAEVVLIG